MRNSLVLKMSGFLRIYKYPFTLPEMGVRRRQPNYLFKYLITMLHPLRGCSALSLFSILLGQVTSQSVDYTQYVNPL